MVANESSRPRPDSDPLRDNWESLGIAFVFNPSGATNADPEKTILQSLGEFKEHRKTLSLVLAWLEKYGTLVHVERLKSLARSLSAPELAWLGGLACYRLKEGDMRWGTIVHFVETKLGKPTPTFPASQLDTLQSERLGLDPCFKRFGLTVPITSAADEKKLTPVSAGSKKNFWLRMRTIFGANWRADMVVVLVLGLARNPYQAEQVLGCSRDTAYRNWKLLKMADVESLFVAERIRSSNG